MTGFDWQYYHVVSNGVDFFIVINDRHWYLDGWSWSHGSWIYTYLCNQCPSPLTLWFRIPLRRGVLDTTLCDKVCKWLAAGWCFSPVSSTNNTDSHDITEILLNVVLNTITLDVQLVNCLFSFYQPQRAAGRRGRD